MAGRPEQVCGLEQEKARRGLTRSLSLELEERGLGGLPHQAAQLRGPDLHGLPEEGGRCTGHPALGSRPEPLP